MGETFALLSMTLFSAANIMISRGALGQSRSRGAFLSIIITFLLSGLIWLGIGTVRGFAAINSTGLAWFALAGILTVLIGRVFLYASIQNLGAMRGSAVKRLNPFFSVLLGVVFLNEAISGSMAAGMALIFASFVLLVHQSLRSARHGGESRSTFGTIAGLGYLYGPISALAYASGYVARKYGLIALPDPVLGTMVGAFIGGLAFVVVSFFIASYREDLQKTFTEFSPWLLAAGFASTLGQICYFVALGYSSVSKIALITSMEVFVTMFLGFILYRSGTRITRELVIAAVLGVFGTVLVISYDA